jgi:aconitase A
VADSRLGRLWKPGEFHEYLVAGSTNILSRAGPPSTNIVLARIPHQNLFNFGILPLTFADGDGYDGVEQGDTIVLEGLHEALAKAGGGEIVARNESQDREIRLRHHLSPRQVDVLLAGGLINWMKDRLT